MPNSKSINTALENSRLCIKESNFEKGVFWILNGLGHNPGAVNLLLELRKTIISLSESLIQDNNFEEAEQRYAWLGRIFQDHIPKVNQDDLSQLLDWMDDLEMKIEGLTPRNIISDESPPKDEGGEASILLKELEDTNGLFSRVPSVIPMELEGIESEYETMFELVDKIEGFELTPENPETLPKVKNYLESLKIATQYLGVRQEIERLYQCIESSLENPGTIYLIQHVDGMLRQLVLLASSLDENWGKDVVKLLDQLHEIDIKRNEETIDSERVELLNDFTFGIEANLASILLKTSKRQKKLEEMNELIKDIHSFRSTNSWSINEEELIAVLEKVQSEAQKVSKSQHQQYNKWAIKNIKDALKAGKNEKGVMWDNKEEIGDAMVKFLGNIDTRFLTMEVNRMYSEVFEYLYDSLKGPKSSEDFGDSSGKLGVVNKMHNKQFKDLSFF